MMSMISNKKYIVVIFLVLFTCFSCGKNEIRPVSTLLSVKHVFDPIVTEMVDSSPIHLPAGISFEATIINSEHELLDSLSSDIIASDTLYNDIDYTNSSLLSVKFRCMYRPNNIDYKIYKESDGQYAVVQMIDAPDSIHAFYVMSNLIVDKLSDNDKIYLWQSFDYEHVVDE